jgi:glycerophosphoryl diester phosphodiesterase
MQEVKMSKLFQLNDIKEFADQNDRCIVLKNDFCFEAIDDGECHECMIVSARSKYVGNAVPYVCFELWINWEDAPEELLYKSPDYVIGSPIDFKQQQWRIPPMFDSRLKLRIKFYVPNGTELILSDFHNSYDDKIRDWNSGIRFNSHLGFYGLAPFNTMTAYELAAKCGYPACIVNPRMTKDGIFVCLHDETINATARDENGNPPDEPMYVCDMTYDELLKWDFGIHKSKLYWGTRIPRLSDFFILCAKTGMRPMFSTHLKMSADQWQHIRSMLEKCKLLPFFHIKSFNLDILEDAYSVFGEDIEGYTWDEGNAEQFKNSRVGQSRRRLVIERLRERTTAEVVCNDRAAGFETAVYNYETEIGCGEDYQKFFDMGVTEFTEDHHCSMGLNW